MIFCKIGFNDSKEGKRKSFKTSYEIIQDYSQYATIQVWSKNSL